MEVSALAGKVTVKIQADDRDFERGIAQAKQKTHDFDRQTSVATKNASASWRRAGVEMQGAAARAAAATDSARGAAMRLATANDTVAGSAARFARANDNVDGSARRMALGLDLARGQLVRFGAALAAAMGGAQFLKAADEFTRFTNALRVAGVEGGEMAAVQDRLFAAANRNGVEIGALGQLYSRASIAAKELGATQEQLLRFVDGVTAALRVQGGSTTQASGALLQLSQALGSGIVRAEEFNSILEGAFPIAQAAARGIDGMGGSVAKLRAAIVEGKITSQEFFAGLLKGFTATEAQAAGMNLTVGAALTVMSNSFTRLVGSIDRILGVSSALASGIAAIGRAMDVIATSLESAVDNLDEFAEMAGIAGVALALAFGPAALGMVASLTVAIGTGLVGAVTALSVAVAANPLGALAIGITAAIIAAYAFRDEIKQAIGVDVFGIAKDTANFIIASFVAAYEDIVLAWDRLPAALGDVIYTTAQNVISGIEGMVQKAVDGLNDLINKYALWRAQIGKPLDPETFSRMIIPPVKFDGPTNPYEGALDEYLKKRKEMLDRIFSTDWLGGLGKIIADAFRTAADATGDLNKALDGTAGAADTTSEAYKKAIKSAEQRIEQMELEIGLVGKTGAAIEAARFAMQLFNDVASENGTVTEKQAQKIEELAARYREVAEALSFARAMDDIKFERAQLGRSEIDQQIYADIRQLGIDINSERGKQLATEMRINEELARQRDEADELKDALKGAASSFLQDLFSGRDVMESIVALGQRFASMNFDKLIDRLTGSGGFLGGLFGNGGSSLGAAAAPARAMGKAIGDQIVEVVKKGVDPWSGMRGGEPGAGFSGQSYTTAVNAGKVMGQTVGPAISKTIQPLATVIRNAANELGISARDLATVISYETGGTFSTSIRGGKNGQHVGLIQFGPTEQRQYGAAIGQALEDQMMAVVRYLKDRGLKPGMGLLDLYSTINAGRPGLYNRSDAGNGGAWGTVQDKVLYQMEGHQRRADQIMAGVPGAVRSGAEAGTSKGAQAGMFDAWAGLREVTPSAASPQQQQNGLGSNGLMSGLSAALGGFSTGYQSANAGMGAFGGFLQGFGATGNIFGGILGGIAGLIGGMLGAKKKLEEARKNLERNMKAIDALLAVGEGRGIGENQKRLTDYLTEIDKAVNLAWKAKEMELVERLQESYNIMFLRLSKDFENAAPGTLRGYLSGRGREDPEMKGAAAVSNLREELRNMIADFRFFGEKRLELTPDTPEKADERAAIIARTEAEVAQATAAARAMALAFLAGVDPLSEVQQAMGSIRGAADTLIPTLVELGMTQAEAAAAIESQVIVALAKVRDEFTDKLTGDINSSKGKGYLAEFKDLFEEFEDVKADAASLGVSGELVGDWLKAMAQGIIDSAELTGTAFQELLQQFPQLEGVVREFVDGMRSSSERLRDYEERLFEATNDSNTLGGAIAEFERKANKERAAEVASGGEHLVLLEQVHMAERAKIMEQFAERAAARALSYQNRLFAAGNDNSTLAGQLAAFDRAAAQERIDEMKAGGEALADLDRALAGERLRIIKDFNDRAIEEEKRRLDEAKSFVASWFRSLKEYVDNLKAGPESPLSNKDRLAEAQSQFAQQYAKALSGDRDAANSLTRYSDNVLDAAKAFYGSTERYQTIFADMIAKLEAIPNQVSAEKFIVDGVTEAIETSTGEIVSATQIMTEALAGAFRSGPTETAAALAAYFDQIDTTMDGLLTFDEIRVALNGKATDAQIRDMMSQIDLNSDGQISKLEAMLAAQGLTKDAIVAAIANGPQTTATLLSTYFNRLDTTMNGLLDFNEMKAALGGVATDAQIRAMMSQLDTDMDGQISKLELIKAATGQTQTNTAAVSADTVHLAHIRNNAREQMETSNILGARRLNALNDIDRLQGGSGAFAAGGLVSGPGSGTSDSIRAWLSNGEFIVNAAATRAIGLSNLTEINRGRLPLMPVIAGNGNDGAIAALVFHIKRLEAQMAEVIKHTSATANNVLRGAAHVGERVDEVAEAVEESANATDRQALRKAG